MKKYLEKGNKQIVQSDYIWPHSASTTPDVMNTSIGPRIKENSWQFHQGMDLPAPLGTPVYSMHSREIYLVGL